MKTIAALASSVLVAARALSAGPAPAGVDLPGSSPFLAPGAVPATGQLPAFPLQLAGVSSAGAKTIVCLFDTRVNKSLWIGVGSSVGILTVLSYDAATDSSVISVNGLRHTLFLRRSASPRPIGPASTPAELKRQQDEARMLVSDLLDIGMEQRREVEQAAKKAAKP